jgi:hypothetical protein
MRVGRERDPKFDFPLNATVVILRFGNPSLTISHLFESLADARADMGRLEWELSEPLTRLRAIATARKPGFRF